MLKFLLSKKLVFLALSFDLSTSTGLQEQNPLLGRGTFGVRQASISTGITIGSLLISHQVQKRRGGQDGQKTGRSEEISQGILSSVHIAAGASNLYQRTR